MAKGESPIESPGSRPKTIIDAGGGRMCSGAGSITASPSEALDGRFASGASFRRLKPVVSKA
jgi:hypothetical protein